MSTDALRWNLMSRPRCHGNRQDLFVVIESDLYASAYGALPRLAEDLDVMHESVYRNHSSPASPPEVRGTATALQPRQPGRTVASSPGESDLYRD